MKFNLICDSNKIILQIYFLTQGYSTRRDIL